MNVRRPPFLASKECLVEGCEKAAPGRHPFCRSHASVIDKYDYRALRFRPTDELLDDALAMIEQYDREAT